MNYRMLLTRAVFCGLATIGYAYGGVINGGFETRDFTNWQMVSGPYDLPDYTYVSTGGCPLNCAAHGGSAFAIIGNDVLGAGISQTFDTVAGYNYSVKFWLSVGVDNAAGDANSLNSYSVFWDSTLLKTVGNSARAGGWQEIPLNAISTSSSSLLTFQFYDNTGSFGLDDVSVALGAPFVASATPEPISMILTGTSLIALAGLSQLLRRRRR